MKWQTGRRSENVEDRRGMRSAGVGIKTGGGLGMVVMVLLALYFGVDPSVILQSGLQQETVDSGPAQAPPAPGEDPLAEFVAVVLGDTEDTWNSLFQAAGERYEEPRLVLFSDAVQSACGYAQAAMGPFYCPSDRKVYIDLSFYRDLRERHAAPGDFAQAYVIAHEVGHHVQNLLGIADRVQRQRAQVDREAGNRLQVRMELQADCFAGLWAHHADRARGILEQGDVEEALNAATAIGDDRLQREAQGYVVPESFTHGSSAQRVRWFKRGLDSGDFEACNTFEAREL
ncbi:MAG TPA: neutral zinc metallopeptidase [Gammaproteobacteria bacterium]|nr:neutral zinc metallopeptidase [Gammaproteobacteria bacterium]